MGHSPSPAVFSGIRGQGDRPRIIVRTFREDDDERQYHFNRDIKSKGEAVEFGTNSLLVNSAAWDDLTLEGKALCESLLEVEGLVWCSVLSTHIEVTKGLAFNWRSVHSQVVAVIAEMLFVTKPSKVQIHFRSN